MQTDSIEQPSYTVAVDCVIFTYMHDTLHIALIERRNDPFAGMCAVPGGLLEAAETVEQAAARELKEETGLEPMYLEQFHVFSAPDRDPRGHVISVAFFGLIPADTGELVAQTDAQRAHWHPVTNLPELAFDHGTIIAQARNALTITAHIKPIICNLLLQYFTRAMLERIYKAVSNEDVDTATVHEHVAQAQGIEKTHLYTHDENQRPEQLYTCNPQRCTGTPLLLPRI